MRSAEQSTISHRHEARRPGENDETSAQARLFRNLLPHNGLRFHADDRRGPPAATLAAAMNPPTFRALRRAQRREARRTRAKSSPQLTRSATRRRSSRQQAICAHRCCDDGARECVDNMRSRRCIMPTFARLRTRGDRWPRRCNCGAIDGSRGKFFRSSAKFVLAKFSQMSTIIKSFVVRCRPHIGPSLDDGMTLACTFVRRTYVG